MKDCCNCRIRAGAEACQTCDDTCSNWEPDEDNYLCGTCEHDEGPNVVTDICRKCNLTGRGNWEPKEPTIGDTIGAFMENMTRLVDKLQVDFAAFKEKQK